MPTKNECPELGPGQLYMVTPDGQTVQLRYSTAEITLADEPIPTEMESGYINPWPTPPEISIELQPSPGFDEWIKGMVQSYIAGFYDRVMREVACIRAWALANRPDLYHAWRRTKKKRTRKKYWKRMVWEYRTWELLEYGTITPNEARRRMGLPPV